MSVNGVTGVGGQDTYSTYNNTVKTTKTTEKTESTATDTASDTGVVYEKSDTGKTYTQNTDLIAKMQADAEAKTAQLRNLVEQMISKQGGTLGKTDSMWAFLASGDFTVDEATKTQAQQDISEDGYWGVKQTADRILDFAEALSGGDPETMEKMRDAFQKGFDEATKTWGKELPSITKDTYDAVMKKFDDYAANSTGSGTTTVTEDSVI